MFLNKILCLLQNEDVVTLNDGTNGSVHEDLSFLKSLSADELIQQFVQGVVKLAINITAAILVFYAGKFVINKIYNIVGRILLRRHVDSSLMLFILSFVKIVLYFILIVSVIGILGIETSSFLALFASAGVAIGMALSGTLQNFAGGVLILLLKPYKVGQYIEVQGYAGTVKEIQIFHTIIITYDNKAITIPNGPISTGTINNWQSEDARRVEWSVAISYGDSVETAREAILNIINADSDVLHNSNPDKIELEQHPQTIVTLESVPPPSKKNFISRFIQRRRQMSIAREEYFRRQVDAKKPNPVKNPAVVLAELADSSVVLKARAWVKTANYWDVFYRINEKIYSELPSAGINFPFPQLDVHFDKNIETP